METYLEGYAKRNKSVNDKLISLARIATKNGFNVDVPKGDGNIKFLRILDGKGKGIYIQWNRLPYHYSFSYGIKPNRKTGSSVYIGEMSNESTPLELFEYCKENLRPFFVNPAFSIYQKFEL